MSYPYAIPECSFVFDKAGWRPAAIEAALTTGRHPVIACGSNRSPDQLARKYFDFAAVTIPVQRAWLADFDVVYAAHITGYGSISACPMPSPGVRVEVSVTWLSDDLMARMHATEGRGHSYDYARLSGLDLVLEGGGVLDSAFAYIHRGGALTVGWRPRRPVGDRGCGSVLSCLAAAASNRRSASPAEAPGNGRTVHSRKRRRPHPVPRPRSGPPAGCAGLCA